MIPDDEPMAEEELQNIPPLNTSGNTPFDVQAAICKETSFEEDAEERLILRLSKFFQYNRQIEPGREYFCPRREPDTSPNVQLVDNQIIIHGFDFMKLKDVKKAYNTNEVVKINPSNFKLVYPDRGSAWKAVEKNIRDATTLVGKMESEDATPSCIFVSI